MIQPVVVTGATGNVGRPLVTELAEAGVEVRAVTRHADTAGFPPGVETYDSAVAALPGAGAVFLNSRALGDAMGPTVDAARAAGVTRLVALSAINDGLAVVSAWTCSAFARVMTSWTEA